MPLWPFLLALAVLLASACEDTVGPGPDASPDQDYDVFDGNWDPPSGQLEVQPSPLVFEIDELGVQAIETVTLSNLGPGNLVIFHLLSAGQQGSAIRVLDADIPLGLHPGDSVELDVSFIPHHCDPAQARLDIFSSDRAESVKQLSIFANGLYAEMEVAPDAIAFGRVGALRAETRDVTVVNNGRCPLTLDSIGVTGSDHFALSLDDPERGGVPLSPSDLPIEVVFGEPLVIHVTYFSPVDQPETATLTIIADEEPEAREIPLSANQRVAPVAVAQATILGLDMPPSTELTAIPLDTVQLDGTPSYDPDGEVVAHHWEILSRPPDSSAGLEPGPDVADPIFFLDLAGDYLFGLTVWDNDEVRSVNEAVIQVTAIPDQDIHVQLVWHTPGDSNELDTYGTDLDLHLVRMPGNWDAPPYDCHWKNMEPDWGESRIRDDDPSLDIDDVDGLGPENINLDRPEIGVTYAIGVYYYSDRDMGPSRATVRVYIDGIPRFELADRELARTDVFWDVGRITWPTNHVDAVDEIHLYGFPTSP